MLTPSEGSITPDTIGTDEPSTFIAGRVASRAELFTTTDPQRAIDIFEELSGANINRGWSHEHSENIVQASVDGEEIARLEYDFIDGDMFILFVTKKSQLSIYNGVGVALFAKLLVDFPDIVRIRMTYSIDNEAMYLNALADSPRDPIKAAIQTRGYERSKHFGFGKVLDFDPYEFKIILGKSK